MRAAARARPRPQERQSTPSTHDALWRRHTHAAVRLGSCPPWSRRRALRATSTRKGHTDRHAVLRCLRAHGVWRRANKVDMHIYSHCAHRAHCGVKKKLRSDDVIDKGQRGPALSPGRAPVETSASSRPGRSPQWTAIGCAGAEARQGRGGMQRGCVEACHGRHARHGRRQRHGGLGTCLGRADTTSTATCDVRRRDDVTRSEGRARTIHPAKDDALERCNRRGSRGRRDWTGAGTVRLSSPQRPLFPSTAPYGGWAAGPAGARCAGARRVFPCFGGDCLSVHRGRGESMPACNRQYPIRRMHLDVDGCTEAATVWIAGMPHVATRPTQDSAA